MISVFCATNRPLNVSRKIASFYQELLQSKGQEAQLLSLEDLPVDFAFNNEVYGDDNAEFREVVRTYVAPVNKFVVVAPEYNGSIPGVFKAFIDGIWPEMLAGKKVALVGVASGRAGNVRGMDHLTNIFNYLEVQVLPYKLPISGVDNLLDESGTLTDRKTIDVMEKQIEALVDF
ncbi:MAG: NAD(P)H-dependent oxidoreductase [Bacteroidota bacterium]